MASDSICMFLVRIAVRYSIQSNNLNGIFVVLDERIAPAGSFLDVSISDYGRRNRDIITKRKTQHTISMRSMRANAAEKERSSSTNREEMAHCASKQDALYHFIAEISDQTLCKDTLQALTNLREQQYPPVDKSNPEYDTLSRERAIRKIQFDKMKVICDPKKPYRSVMLMLHLQMLIPSYPGYYAYIRSHCPDPQFMDRFREYVICSSHARIRTDPKNDIDVTIDLAMRYICRWLPSYGVTERTHNELTAISSWKKCYGANAHLTLSSGSRINPDIQSLDTDS